MRSLKLPLINCEIELDLRWSGNYVLLEDNDNIKGVNFIIIVVHIVTLSVNDNIKFLENIKQGFERTVSWSKYRSFTSIDRLFVLPFKFKNGNSNPAINYFHKYYMSLVEMKDFNAFIDNKSVFDQPVKIKEEAYEKFIENVKKR